MTSHRRQDTLTELLRESLPIMKDQPTPDMWRHVVAGLNRGRPSPASTEWILLGLIIVSCIVRPEAVVLLLMHF